MFVVLLRFAENRKSAGLFLEAHKAWLRQGFEDGVFVLSGSLQPAMGGALLAHNTTHDDLQARIDDDPFVAERVVSAEILEIDVSRADERLEFLLTRTSA